MPGLAFTPDPTDAKILACHALAAQRCAKDLGFTMGALTAVERLKFSTDALNIAHGCVSLVGERITQERSFTALERHESDLTHLRAACAAFAADRCLYSPDAREEHFRQARALARGTRVAHLFPVSTRVFDEAELRRWGSDLLTRPDLLDRAAVSRFLGEAVSWEAWQFALLASVARVDPSVRDRVLGPRFKFDRASGEIPLACQAQRVVTDCYLKMSLHQIKALPDLAKVRATVFTSGPPRAFNTVAQIFDRALVRTAAVWLINIGVRRVIRLLFPGTRLPREPPRHLVGGAQHRHGRTAHRPIGSRRGVAGGGHD